MSWSIQARIVDHPSGDGGFAIEVTLSYGDTSYKGLVTGIGQRLKDIPCGHVSTASLALKFRAYYEAQTALKDVEEKFARGQLGGLWPKCLHCLNFLSLNGKINTKCSECGHNNPW